MDCYISYKTDNRRTSFSIPTWFKAVNLYTSRATTNGFHQPKNSSGTFLKNSFSCFLTVTFQEKTEVHCDLNFILNEKHCQKNSVFWNNLHFFEPQYRILIVVHMNHVKQAQNRWKFRLIWKWTILKKLQPLFVIDVNLSPAFNQKTFLT